MQTQYRGHYILPQDGEFHVFEGEKGDTFLVTKATESDAVAFVDERVEALPVSKASLTRPMKRAILMFHGSAKSASEAKADKRSVDALIRMGLLRWSSGRPNRKLYVLTAKGIDLNNTISMEEAGF